ncbi:MAG: hypothetical protein IKR04_01860 [Clostridia bacterium]|nr:hypothetical protein [Clostridia bacterium]
MEEKNIMDSSKKLGECELVGQEDNTIKVGKGDIASVPNEYSQNPNVKLVKGEEHQNGTGLPGTEERDDRDEI